MTGTNKLNKPGFPGYVYALENPAWRCIGLLKIGHTINDPRVRLRQLTSSSGLLASGHVAFCIWVADCVAVENAVKYNILRHRRVRRNRELYRVTPYEAKIAIERAAAQAGGPLRPILLPQRTSRPTRHYRWQGSSRHAIVLILVMLSALLLLF